MSNCIRLLFTCILAAGFGSANAQFNAARYEIDAKRLGVTFADKDALPRGREFIRLDSTYYVGWLYEGMFKYDRAADYLGYRNCIGPLRRAFTLFEKDHRNNFQNIFTTYGFAASDITQLCYALYDSYSNIEEPDSAMWLLDRVQGWHAGVDFMQYHIKAAWTIHRNRYILHKYAFLRNSVSENEDLALHHLYTALAEGDGSAVFYLAIIHNYLLNMDSTAYYYDLLRQVGGFSYNNYAHFQNTLGNFAAAIENFEKDMAAYDKRLIEAYYFLPTLFINSGQSRYAIDETNDIIRSNGSTPGFGWYNIALARSYLYNGQLDSCEKAIDKAAQFRELHIGTTLGQAQYEFAINSVKLLLVKNKLARIKFLNRGWWYSPTDLAEVGALSGQALLLKFALVSELSTNPERELVVYNIFASENVIGFDEILTILENISPPYFEKIYQQKENTETRKNIVRYMQLFYGEFAYENGDYRQSQQTFENILNTALLDTAHEKLFIARLFQDLARGYRHGDEDARASEMQYRFFTEYPQLLPFSGFTQKMHLVTDAADGVEDRIIRDLKGCNIDFTGDGGPETPQAVVHFTVLKGKYEADFQVTDASGKFIVPPKKMYFKKAAGVGNELAMRLCGVDGPAAFENP